MKKLLALTLACLMALSLVACGNNNSDTPSDTQPVEITVFAAASLTETLTEIIENYKAVAPNVTITPTFDSSGILLSQIEEGAACDIFFSAAQKQMNAVDVTADAEKNPDGLDFVDPDTRINILENQVTLVVPEGNPANISSFADLQNAQMLALGNSDVPVGSYSLKILDYLGLDITALENAGKVTYGSNVKEVTTQVSEGIVDCGIIYATDAFSEGLTVVDTATAEMCGQVIYPLAMLKQCAHPDEAKAFLAYLQSADAMTIFESVGFTAVA